MQTNMPIDDPTLQAKQETELRQRKSRAVLTAWILAAVAVAVFTAFVLSGVLAE